MFPLLSKVELLVRAEQRVPTGMSKLPAPLIVASPGLLHALAPPALGQADTTGILRG